ncbi:MAG: V-type ATP synthase subunit K [Lentisphaerae bacterium]|jgi:V/A-type H+-transporting ATPase subunit K|nr:V-type ATP synthase subunit K [Lentisphaerota bacterium]
MLTSTQIALQQIGAFCAIGFAALGSTYGCGVAAASAIGAWKKCYLQGKMAPFQLSILAGVAMSQTIYGLILMLIINGKTSDPTCWPTCLAIGLFAGILLGISSVFQGRAAAGACDAFAETGQGFVNYLIALGVIETIAIFVMAFAILLLGSVGVAPEVVVGG